MATKQISVERFTITSAKPFSEVVKALEASVVIRIRACLRTMSRRQNHMLILRRSFTPRPALQG
jgi:hypothetical protein